MTDLYHDWTPDRVSQLTKLWSDGYSARKIAELMGLSTRNQVIGKARRLKLSNRGPALNDLRAGAKRAAAKLAKLERQAELRAKLVIVRKRKISKPLPEAPPVAPTELPDLKMIPFTDRT